MAPAGPSPSPALLFSFVQSGHQGLQFPPAETTGAIVSQVAKIVSSSKLDCSNRQPSRL